MEPVPVISIVIITRARCFETLTRADQLVVDNGPCRTGSSTLKHQSSLIRKLKNEDECQVHKYCAERSMVET